MDTALSRLLNKRQQLEAQYLKIEELIKKRVDDGVKEHRLTTVDIAHECRLSQSQISRMLSGSADLTDVVLEHLISRGV